MICQGFEFNQFLLHLHYSITLGKKHQNDYLLLYSTNTIAQLVAPLPWFQGTPVQMSALPSLKM
jgi:hypothetical protein